MDHQTAVRRAVVLSAVAATLLAAGCAKPSQYQAPVSKFRDASAAVIESTKTYLVALNKTERDHYIDDQVESRSAIQLSKINEVQVFSPEAIAVRLDALDRVADYTELLYRLTTSDAPETVQGKAKDLGEAVTTLSQKVSSIAGADDARFKAAADKVFPILGEVLKAFVNQRIDAALRQAITTGAGPVNELIDAIRKDVDLAYERKRNVLSKRRADAALEYNRVSAKPGVEAATLRRYADAIKSAEDQWEAFQTARPGDGLAAMQQANLALEKFARTPRPNPADFGVFAGAVEVFASAAERVGTSVERFIALQDRSSK